MIHIEVSMKSGLCTVPSCIDNNQAPIYKIENINTSFISILIIFMDSQLVFSLLNFKIPCISIIIIRKKLFHIR